MNALAEQHIDDPVRERILDAFTARAGEIGLRALVMSDLASDLGISKKTLYQHYRSKAELVQELIERWVADMQESERQRMEHKPGVREGIRAWASNFVESRGKLSPVFWRDLRRDYPEQHKIYAGAFEASRQRANMAVRNHLRGGVPPELATELFGTIIRRVIEPAVYERLGMTRKAALLAALDIWANGALRDDRPVREVD